MRSLHTLILNTRCGFIILLISLFFVVGCHVGKWDVNYPDTWSPQVENLMGECPLIAGRYLNQGERRLSSAGADCYSNCGALISELKDGNKVLSYNNLADKERIKDRIIELRQPTDKLLDVIEWKDVNGELKEMSQFQLSAENGDFFCEDGDFRLKNRVYATILLIGNAVTTESRVFNMAEDGALIMKRFTKTGGHAFIFPEAYGVGEWVRWPAVERLFVNEQDTDDLK